MGRGAEVAGCGGARRQAFGVNVNAFWTGDAAAECEALRRVLTPRGPVRLVYEVPGPGGRDVGALVAANLERHGYRIEVERHGSDNLVSITGRLASVA